MKKKMLAILLAAATAVMTCMSGTAVFAQEERDSLKVVVSGDPNTLAPNGNSVSPYIVPQIYDQLWFLTDGELVMRVATGYEAIDTMHYTITIQPDIKDTAGNSITASDVLYSINLAKNGSMGYPGSARYIDVDNSSVSDDVTLNIVLTQPCSFAMKALSMVNLVSQASYEASEDGMVTTPVGSGPYMLEEYVTGSYVKLKANPDYWDGAAQIENVNVQFVAEASQRANVMLTGEADASFGLSYTDEGALSAAEGIDFASYTNIGTYVLFFNNSSSSVCGGNLDFRKAVAYACNREAMIAATMGGYGKKSISCISKNFSDYSDEIGELSADTNYYDYNLELAKEYLAASGVPEGTTLRIANGAGAGQDSLAMVLQANLSDIGINAQIDTYPDTQSTVIMNQPDDWDLALWSWTNYPAQSGLATLNAFGTSGANGYFQLEGEEMESWTAALNAALEADEASFGAKMTELMKYMYDNLPVYGLFDTCNLEAYSSDLNIVWKCIDFPILYKWSWK